MITLVAITSASTLTSIGSGLQNTTNIYNGTGATSISIAYNFTDGTYSDWFLPSKDELFQVVTNLAYGPSRNNFGFGTSFPIRTSSITNPTSNGQTFAYSVNLAGVVSETVSNNGGCSRFVLCRYF